MIKRSFSHVEGISFETEKILYEHGIYDWETFLKNYDNITFLSETKLEKLKEDIIRSLEELETNNLEYFKERVHPKEQWRLVPHAKVCYVDIETTGLSPWTNDITIIGVYDGNKPELFIKGENLEKAKERLKEFDMIVTFNGKLFDIPFIEQKLDIKIDSIHLDLRFMLREFGLKGGLKNIERELGMARNDLIKDIDGREAVTLWKRYERGDKEALKLLKMYNIEDIVNLQHLLEYYIRRKQEESDGL